MTIAVYTEAGRKRTFAGAIDWPGWCRSARDEMSALQALLDYGPRYLRALHGTALKFTPPTTISELKVVERLQGGSGTDFGAPERPPTSDAGTLGEADLSRLEELLMACWRQFDAVAKAAKGKKLLTGPRGGGRDLAKMLAHVREGEQAYVGQLGWWALVGESLARERGLEQVREAAIKGLRASAHGEIPAFGPRGGKRWSTRYFVRRAAWHVLDHAWELEDRLP